MKLLPRIAAISLAASLLMAGGVVGAMANETAPAVQQSNVKPTEEMLTVEVTLKDHIWFFEAPNDERTAGWSRLSWSLDEGIPASPPILWEDGTEWRLVQMHTGGAGDRGGIFYIPESVVALVQPLGTAAAAKKIADAAAKIVRDKYDAQFSGQGIIRSGGSWYSSEDSGTAPISTATGLGFQARMSEAYEAGSKKWHKLSTGEDQGIAYVLAENVTFTPETPTEEPTPEHSEAPLIPADPEDHPANANNQAADASPEAGTDKPGNIWAVVIGGGAVVTLAAGGYLFMQQRKRMGAAAVTEGVEEVSGE